VFALLIVGVVVAVPVLYAADRIIKAQARARRVRTMSERLTAATARADKQHERQQEVAQASAELTSLMPAISRPPLTLPDEAAPDQPGSDEPRPDEPISDEAEPGEPTAATSPLPPIGRPDAEPPLIVTTLTSTGGHIPGISSVQMTRTE
jgi:type II secretory pathway pseudopilin PulG